MVCIRPDARLALTFALCFASASALADDLDRPVRVIDGDTIQIAGTRIRLFGIDAPESEQTCSIGNDEYRCGEEATAALTKLIGEREVKCEGRGWDRHRRMLAVCWIGDIEINATMVRSGHALAFIRYSKAYIQEEAAAKAERLGVWRGTFLAPWDWRAQKGMPSPSR